MNKKYLFFWEVKNKLNQTEYLIGLLKKVNKVKSEVKKKEDDMEEKYYLIGNIGDWSERLEIEQHNDYSNLYYFIKKKRKSVSKNMEELIENEYLFKELLMETDTNKNYFVGSDFTEINFKLYIDKLTAKRGEYKSIFLKSIFNLFNPLTISIRIIDFLSSAMSELLKKLFLLVNIKYERIENVMNFILKTFFSVLLASVFTFLLDKYGIFDYLFNFFS